MIDRDLFYFKFAIVRARTYSSTCSLQLNDAYTMWRYTMFEKDDIQIFEYTLNVHLQYNKNLVQANIWYRNCITKYGEYTMELLYIKYTDIVPNDFQYIVSQLDFVYVM